MKTVFLAITSVLILILITSCSTGVSQEQYKKATDDLAIAQSQVQTLETQLSSVQAQTQTLNAQVSLMQTQNQTLQSDLNSAKNKISRAKLIADLIDSMVQVGMNLENLTNAQLANYYVQWANNVKAIDDPTLSSKFESYINFAGTSQETQTANDFVLYLYSLQSKSLQ